MKFKPEDGTFSDELAHLRVKHGIETMVCVYKNPDNNAVTTMHIGDIPWAIGALRLGVKVIEESWAETEEEG